MPCCRPELLQVTPLFAAPELPGLRSKYSITLPSTDTPVPAPPKKAAVFEIPWESPPLAT